MRDPLPRIPKTILANPQARLRLLERVEDLIVVLVAAQSHAQELREGEGAGGERLSRAKGNLSRMLKVCHEARSWLAHPTDSGELTLVRPMTFREYVEISSFAEYLMLRQSGPITETEVLDADVEELCRLFGSGDLGADAA